MRDTGIGGPWLGGEGQMENGKIEFVAFHSLNLYARSKRAREPVTDLE